MEKLRVKISRVALTVLVIGFLALVISVKQQDDGRFHLYFFDVGQGDSAFIKTPDDYEILIDGGPNNDVMTELSKAMGFLDRSIDLVILTHPHADHVAGLTEVLKKYEIGAVMITGVIYENGYYNEFLKVIKEKDIPVIFADESKDFSIGSTYLDTIYPFKKMVEESVSDVNNSSIVVKIKYKEVSMLFTGDAGEEIEQMITQRGVDLRAKILKVGHHGSKYSSTPEFLSKVQPEIAIIQVGVDNQYGHPNEQTIENLKKAGIKQLYRNDLDGTIEFSF